MFFLYKYVELWWLMSWLEPTTCSGLIWLGLRTFLIRSWITNKNFQMAWIALLPLLKSELLTEPFEWNADGLEGSPISFRDSGHGEWDVSVSFLVIIPMLSWEIPAILSKFTRSLANPGFGFRTWRCCQEVSASKECSVPWSEVELAGSQIVQVTGKQGGK